MARFIQILLLVAMATQATSFAPASSTNLGNTRGTDVHQPKNVLFMAGFGGGGTKGKGGKKKATPIKLKPKLQWDRFEALKKDAPSVPVGTRLVDEENPEWLAVGKVKSKDGDL